MKIKITKSDIIWNYLGTLFSMGSNFLLLPFLINYLDAESLGLWYIFLSVGGVVILFDFGFNPTFARNVAYCWSGASELIKTDVVFSNNKEPNISLLKKLIYACKRIYLIIALLAVILLLTVGTIYILYVSRRLIGYRHIIAWIIYSSAVFLNMYYGYYMAFLRGVGAIKQINFATVISRVLQIITSIVLLFLGLDIIGISIAYLLYGLAYRLIAKNEFYKYENIGKRIKDDPIIITGHDIKLIFATIWHNAWRDGVVSLSNYLMNQATVIICSIYFSLTVTGIYSISLQLVTAITTISSTLYTTYQPSLQEAYINKDITKSKKIMSTAMTVYIILFILGLVTLILIGIPVLRLVKNDIGFDIPILLGISVYLFLLNHHSLYISYISNGNRVPYMKAYLISSLFSICLSVFLIEFSKFGIWALIGAQIFAQIIYNNWKWPYIVMKSLNTNPIEMFVMGLNELKLLVQLRLKTNINF